jgi:predicted nuclease with RNAse H fold
MRKMKIVGIDLAGSEKRITGFCLLDEKLNTKTKILYTDEEIISETINAKPDVISIDAPLSLPLGRKSLSQRKAPHLRACDRELLRMKIKFFPITLGPMRKLTERGIKLKKFFESKGFEVIESFPGAAQDMLKMPRKKAGLEKLRRALINFGIKGDVKKRKITAHELDAITSALVGKMYLEKNYLAIGNPREGLIILPKILNSFSFIHYT